MAKLLKASTARKRASEIDTADLVLQGVVDDINYAVSRGQFAVGVIIPTYAEAKVIETLEAAGYDVTYPLYAQALAQAEEFVEDTRGWFAKLFGWNRVTQPPVDLSFTKSGTEFLMINWSQDPPAPEDRALTLE